MEFAYVSVDDTGKKQKGILESNNEKQVAEYLRKNNLVPIFIKEKKPGGAISFLPFKKVSNGDVVIFTRQISSMIMTGLTLIESLTILKKQSTNPNLANILNDITSSISEGKSFSQALSDHKDVFSEVYIALIQAAETGGLLDKVLARLADNLEKSEDLRKRIKSAMFYPAIVIVGVVGVIAVMNIFVIPQLSTLYENLNLSLPFITQVVLTISSIFRNFFPVFIGAGIGGYVLYQRFYKTPFGRKKVDTYKLKIPVFGSIATLSVLDEITRTLSLLIGAGTSIIQALNITANVSNNVLYKEAVIASSTMVEKGIPLSQAFESQGLFPPMLIQMIKVGEATGKIDESLEKMGEYFERDLDLKIKTLTTSIEPILIIVLGVAVAFLILSVITPIYGLISQIQ